MFVGTEVEGGIFGCLVKNPFGTERAGYGLTLTSDSMVHFTATVEVVTASLDYEVEIEKWIHLTLQYDHQKTQTRMWASYGDGNKPVLVAQNKYPYEEPMSVKYFIHNDMLLGLYQPLFNSPSFHYSGYIDELRFWSRTIDIDEMTQSLYRGYRPNQDYLQGIGMQGYYPMNAVKCTPELCSGAIGMQQWIHIGGTSLFTSSLVLYASPKDADVKVAGLDCRYRDFAGANRGCLCHIFPAGYCWHEVKRQPVYCEKECTRNLDPNLKNSLANEKTGLFEQKEYKECFKVQCYGPFGAPKCLQPFTSGNISSDKIYEIEISTCIESNNMQKWTAGPVGTYYQILNAQKNNMGIADMCLCSVKKEPFRGSPVTLEKCLFNQGLNGEALPPPPHQAWRVDPTGLQVRNQLSGFCLSASLLENGAIPYLIDCVSVDILDTTTPVQTFLFDWAAGRSGILVGGAYLTSMTDEDKCDGKTLCDPTVRAPIDQKPIITHVNSEPLTSYRMDMVAYANKQFVVTLTARDPNVNDDVQFDFKPFDVVLQTEQGESIQWPPAFICEDGLNNMKNCTCLDYACSAGRLSECN